MTDSRALNIASWNERAPVHAASVSYPFDQFAADPKFLSEVIRFDLPRLGDLTGLEGVHLQCHIGTDTVSLSRLGARMTGLDFSAASVAQARRLATLAAADVEFVEADVYAALETLGRDRFDLVFTGVGALCWLPDIQRWADVVAALLRPGGRLFLREGHPVLWAVDDLCGDGVLALDYPYFETVEPTVWNEGGTYVETDAVLLETTTHCWNHGLGEIITALLSNGLELTRLEEHDSIPWEALPGFMARDEHHEWRLTDRPARLPLSYTLEARKR